MSRHELRQRCRAPLAAIEDENTKLELLMRDAIGINHCECACGVLTLYPVNTSVLQVRALARSGEPPM